MPDMFEHQVQVEVERRIKKELEQLVENPDVVIAAYAEKLKRAHREIEDMRPKAEFYDAVTQSDEWEEMAAVAKVIGRKKFGRNNIFQFLRDRGVLRKNNEPYQQYVERGYLKVVEQKWENPKTGEVMISMKPVVSQKGIDFIRRLLEGEDS